MAKDVLQTVLEKCRTAMLSGIPIVFIKTDSDVFIRNLVMNEDAPLVALVQKENGRLIYEAPPEERLPENCKNYFEDNSLAFRSNVNLPIIASFKVQQGNAEFGKSFDFKLLEKYVLLHENEKSSDYDRLQSSLIILYSSDVNLSPMLQPYTEIIELDYPSEGEIDRIIRCELGSELEEIIGGNGKKERESNLSKLCQNLLGFTSEEVTAVAKRILALVSINSNADAESKMKMALDVVRSRKKQKLQGGLLEQSRTDSNMAGMHNFRKWLMKQKMPLDEAGKYKQYLGIDPPNGVLLCGVPGCGKTEAARFAAQELNLPMLKMDIGSLMDKYVGSSEAKMRDALKLAEAMSPCVLLIDEIEKGFSGAGSEGGDSSSFKRMFGYMLGWMQDNESPCFIFATANDISGLPKEFFRSGRFDALYAVFLPTAKECAEIFASRVNQAEKRVRGEEKKRREAKGMEDEDNDDEDKEVLFYSGAAKDTQLYLDIINKYLVKDGNPSIIIGSDIQKVFDIALRSFSQKVIDGGIIEKQEWKEALVKVIKDDSFAAYGKGTENLDSIVLSYCRMLRKGFISTSDKPLIEAKQYHPEKVSEIDKLKEQIRECRDSEELEKLKQKLEKCTILELRSTSDMGEYDKAVYNCLFERINSVAYDLEKYEKNVMMRR